MILGKDNIERLPPPVGRLDLKKLAALACGLAVAAFAQAAPEDDLLAQLPAIFEKSAAHYRALDAAATPLMRDGADRARYRAFAVRQLLALASPAYFSEGDEIGHFLLKHGVGHKPARSEIDTPLDYGDYYFLEALLRFRELKAQEARRAKLAAKD